MRPVPLSEAFKSCAVVIRGSLVNDDAILWHYCSATPEVEGDYDDDCLLFGLVLLLHLRARLNVVRDHQSHAKLCQELQDAMSQLLKIRGPLVATECIVRAACRTSILSLPISVLQQVLGRVLPFLAPSALNRSGQIVKATVMNILQEEIPGIQVVREITKGFQLFDASSEDRRKVAELAVEILIRTSGRENRSKVPAFLDNYGCMADSWGQEIALQVLQILLQLDEESKGLCLLKGNVELQSRFLELLLEEDKAHLVPKSVPRLILDALWPVHIFVLSL